MNTYFYKLKFNTPIHFGMTDLSSCSLTIFSDTLFSALYIEALKLDDAEMLYGYVQSGNLLVSDLMPYNGDTYYIPKPIMMIRSDKKSDSSLKKQFKKLSHIPIDDIEPFLEAEYDPKTPLEKLSQISSSSLRQMVNILPEEDNKPYSVGICSFREKCGLYFILQADSDAKTLMDKLMKSLSYAGLGGKRSAGFGRFEYECVEKELPKPNSERGVYMSLSVCLPKDDELDGAMENATFELIKRSGFVASESYSETPLRKRDLFCFKGGSVFRNRFEGDVFDVSSGGAHPVYRYARPMWLSL